MLVDINDERLWRPLPDGALEKLSRNDLLVLARNEISLRRQAEDKLREATEKQFELEGKYFRIHSRMFLPSSERRPRSSDNDKKDPKPRDPQKKQLTDRYPDADIIAKDIVCETLPDCPCCGGVMQDSGMTETSEYLTVVPKKYIIVRQHRHKYRCGKCHGSIVTTPAIPRVIPKSSYSDEMIVDATLSKYCDLIPMERYCAMASRQGFDGLPPHSLIQASIKLSEFLMSVYLRIKEETLSRKVLCADETPHKMLEGDPRKKWFLWGFSSEDNSVFYECHDTRSGDVASNVLTESKVEVLVSDVYCGYKKAVREANEKRLALGLTLIAMAYCNSHARRGFVFKEGEAPVEAEKMLEWYQEIYRLEDMTKEKSDEETLEIRAKMKPIFEEMKAYADEKIETFSDKSAMAQGFNYFIKNYEGLTLFLSNPQIPIDNNGSERLLRSHVVGRKTWYGTHSKDGAEAAAIHFTLVESCKLNKVNPRQYYRDIIERIHAGRPVITPLEFKRLSETNISTND